MLFDCDMMCCFVFDMVQRYAHNQQATKHSGKKNRHFGEIVAKPGVSNRHFLERRFETQTKNAFNVGNLKTPKMSSCAISS